MYAKAVIGATDGLNSSQLAVKLIGRVIIASWVQLYRSLQVESQFKQSTKHIPRKAAAVVNVLERD